MNIKSSWDGNKPLISTIIHLTQICL